MCYYRKVCAPIWWSGGPSICPACGHFDKEMQGVGGYCLSSVGLFLCREVGCMAVSHWTRHWMLVVRCFWLGLGCFVDGCNVCVCVCLCVCVCVCVCLSVCLSVCLRVSCLLDTTHIAFLLTSTNMGQTQRFHSNTETHDAPRDAPSVHHASRAPPLNTETTSAKRVKSLS